MEEQFIPYDLAIKLKELGFDNKCFGDYTLTGDLISPAIDFYDWDCYYRTNCIPAPLWQQAFDWFEDKYTFCISFARGAKFYSYGIADSKLNSHRDTSFITRLEAKEACLRKLIEII